MWLQSQQWHDRYGVRPPSTPGKTTSVASEPTVARQIWCSSSVNSKKNDKCGIRANCGTTDMVLALGKLQEKCQEQNTVIYATFADLAKAFEHDMTMACPETTWLSSKFYSVGDLAA